MHIATPKDIKVALELLWFISSLVSRDLVPDLILARIQKDFIDQIFGEEEEEEEEAPGEQEISKHILYQEKKIIKWKHAN